VAGPLLGIVLLLTFILTGHGLGATGFTTRVTAWLGGEVAPRWTLANDYLGPMIEDGSVLSSWITWEVLGVFAGAFFSARLARRMAWRIEGAATSGTVGRLLKALAAAFWQASARAFPPGAPAASGCRAPRCWVSRASSS